MNEKKCTCCGDVKPLDQYNKDHGKSGGLGTQCRACKALAYKAWRAKCKAERVDLASPWAREKVQASLDSSLMAWRYPVSGVPMLRVA